MFTCASIWILPPGWLGRCAASVIRGSASIWSISRLLAAMPASIAPAVIRLNACLTTWFAVVGWCPYIRPPMARWQWFLACRWPPVTQCARRRSATGAPQERHATTRNLQGLCHFLPPKNRGRSATHPYIRMMMISARANSCSLAVNGCFWLSSRNWCCLLMSWLPCLLNGH